MHTDAFHTALALIDHLAPLVPRIALHDRALAHSLREAATAIPAHVAAGRLGRAHRAAGRVHTVLLVTQAWDYLPGIALADAQLTAHHLHSLTA